MKFFFQTLSHQNSEKANPKELIARENAAYIAAYIEAKCSPKSTEIDEGHRKYAIKRTNAAYIAAYIAAKCSLY